MRPSHQGALWQGLGQQKLRLHTAAGVLSQASLHRPVSAVSSQTLAEKVGALGP